MPARAPSALEQQLLDDLTLLSGPVGTFAITRTGLGKSIFDARWTIPSILADAGIHDYEQQPHGPQASRQIPCRCWDGSQDFESNISLYRSLTRGDRRFSIPGFAEMAEADDIGALFADAQGHVRIVNVTAVLRTQNGRAGMATWVAGGTVVTIPGPVAPVLAAVPVPPGAGTRGQGQLLSAAARIAMERYSRDLAIQHYTGQGWALVSETSGTGPFDLKFANGVADLYVEVKSTRNSGFPVTVTRGEVQSAGAVPTALFLVTDCQVTRDATGAIEVQGGRRWIWEPWTPSPPELEALTFKFSPSVPPQQQLD